MKTYGPSGTAAALPTFSVVIPTFNRSRLLDRAIASVLEQDLEDLEVLVVDDGSEDGVRDKLTTLKDPRLRILSQPHRGVSAARNLGARHARGRLLTFLDSDDEATKDWLTSLAAAFAPEDVGIVCGGMRVLVQRAGEVIEDSVRLPGPGGALFHHQTLLYTAGCLAVQRSLFIDCGGYVESIRFAENAELAMRLIPHCLRQGLRVTTVNRPLVVYHKQADLWAIDPARQRTVQRSVEQILDRHGDKLRRDSPDGYVNYRGVAAVNAARLDDFAAARQHLAAALRVRPRHVKNYLRWALTLAPPLAKCLWTRHTRRVPSCFGP